jgi:CMP-N,N'-diacetyllegionaminic acid synthase
MNNKAAAIIPARGGSKGIPKKNIIPLAGKPLILYSIETALKSKYIDKLFVSSDDDEILRISRNNGADIIKRPKEFAQDDTPDLPVFQHAIRFLKEKFNYKPGIIINLRPTCPLRNVDDIDNSVKKMLDTGCDAVRTITEARKHPYWMGKLDGDRLLPFMDNINVEKYYQRQLLPQAYIINGGVDVMKADVIINQNRLYGDDVRAVFMPLERSIDIDTKFDFMFAESIILGSRKNV